MTSFEKRFEKRQTVRRHDSKGAFEGLNFLKGRFNRLKVIFADGAYRGDLIDEVKKKLQLVLEIRIVKYAGKGFQVIPKRWVVERAFSWFESYRCLSKDFERHPSTSETMIKLCMVKLMVNRL